MVFPRPAARLPAGVRTALPPKMIENLDDPAPNAISYTQAVYCWYRTSCNVRAVRLMHDELGGLRFVVVVHPICMSTGGPRSVVAVHPMPVDATAARPSRIIWLRR
jgi:hypothetical protein